MDFEEASDGSSATFDALVMSLVAGLSTGIGGSVVFCFSSVSPRTMAFTLALAGGVMTSVSILELMKPFFHGSPGPFMWAAAGGIFYAVLRELIPEPTAAAAAATGHKRGDDAIEEDSEYDADAESALKLKARQWRLGLLMMVTLTAHNLPEGVAVAVGALSSRRTGLVVRSAIAMHNIPEGLAIAIPIYAATGSRLQALAMTLASGLSEPLGAGLGVLVLRPILTHSVVDNATCAVGGIMLAVSFLELAPESRKHGDLIASVAGLSVGWLVIILTVRFA